MTVVVPAVAKGPVPLLMMFAPSALPAPVQPPAQDLDRINAALRRLLAANDPALGQIFAQYPGYSLVPVAPPMFGPPPARAGDPPTQQQLIADGWGFALLDPASAQADNAEGLRSGIIGLVNHGQFRHPDDWGALRAWSWAAARGLDYLESDPAVNAKQVGIEGVSRYGKAALVTLAFEPRFAMGLIGSSGEGGAKLHRRNLGEAVESLTGGEYYWMAGNFMKYGAADATFGSLTAEDLPVDAHELIALCAPRLTFISYGSPAAGDAKVARSAGQLYGDRGRRAGVCAARRQGAGHWQRLPDRQNAAGWDRAARRSAGLAPARGRPHGCTECPVLPRLGGCAAGTHGQVSIGYRWQADSRQCCMTNEC